MMKQLLRTGLITLLVVAFAPTTVRAQQCRSWQPCSSHRYGAPQSAPEISSSRLTSGIALAVGVALIAGFGLRRRNVAQDSSL